MRPEPLDLAGPLRPERPTARSPRGGWRPGADRCAVLAAEAARPCDAGKRCGGEAGRGPRRRRQRAAHPVPEPRGEPPDGRFCHTGIACRDEHHPPSYPPLHLRHHPAVTFRRRADPLPHRAPQGRDPDGDRPGRGRPVRPPGTAGHPRRGHRPAGGHRTAHLLPLFRHQGGGGRAPVRRRRPALGRGRPHRPGPPHRPAGPGTRRRAHPHPRRRGLGGLLGMGAHPDPPDRHQPRPAQGLGRGGPDLGGGTGGDPGATAGDPGMGSGVRGGSGRGRGRGGCGRDGWGTDACGGAVRGRSARGGAVREWVAQRWADQGWVDREGVDRGRVDRGWGAREFAVVG